MAKISIDFVSDVACPWCAVGLGGLLAAIERLRGEAEVELHFRPFELNPDMPKGGQNTIERLMAKYGYDRERIQANRKVISERAAAVGMPMRMADDNRSYNTFDAHRLLHWAGLQDPALQVALKKRLLAVYHDDNLTRATPRCWRARRPTPAWTRRRRARCWRPAAMPMRSGPRKRNGAIAASRRCRR